MKFIPAFWHFANKPPRSFASHTFFLRKLDPTIAFYTLMYHLWNYAISYSNGYTPLILAAMMNGGLCESKDKVASLFAQHAAFKKKPRGPNSTKTFLIQTLLLSSRPPHFLSVFFLFLYQFKFKTKEDYYYYYSISKPTYIRATWVCSTCAKKIKREFAKTWKSIGNLAIYG